MTYFITIAGRRWPVEETFKTGKDVLGWDQSQARLFEAICRHTALAALAQLRAAAIRGALDGSITLPAAGPASSATAATAASATLSCRSPSATRPSRTAAASPARPASRRSGCRSPRPSGSPALPCNTPPGSSPAPGSPSRCAGHGDARRAPSRRPLAPLQRPAACRQDRVTSDGRKEVTPCNRTSEPGVTLSGSAATRRKTATVIQTGSSRLLVLSGSAPGLVDQGFAESGHPQLRVILPDAQSGRDTGELRVEQLATQRTAHRTAGRTCRTHARNIVHLLVSAFHAGHPPREDSRPPVMLGRPGARALLARPFNGLSTACTSQRRCARPDWTAAVRRRARPR